MLRRNVLSISRSSSTMLFMNSQIRFFGSTPKQQSKFFAQTNFSSPKLFCAARFSSSSSPATESITSPRQLPSTPFPHPQELVDKMLELVNLSKAPPHEDEEIPPLGDRELKAIARLDKILFYEGYIPEVEKFAVLRSLLYYPAIRQNKKYILPVVHQIMQMLIPDTIFKVLRDVDIDANEHFQETETMEKIEEFFGTIIEGKTEEAEIAKMFQALQHKVKALATLRSFGEFVHSMGPVIAQCRTATAVTEACLKFDPQETGRIKTYEMRLVLEEVIPEDLGEVSDGSVKKVLIDEVMLDVAEQTDEEGFVAYQQLRKL
jgi:Ca2+-binding EF-hand superfamily protein